MIISQFQSLFALYSMIYTDYPMGQDPTALSHAYDLVCQNSGFEIEVHFQLGAYECLFVSVFLHYKCFRLRYHPIPPVELRFSRDEESDHYFNELRTSWAWTSKRRSLIPEKQFIVESHIFFEESQTYDSFIGADKRIYKKMTRSMVLRV